MALLQRPLGDLVLVDVGGPALPAQVGRHTFFLGRVERRPAQARGDLWWMGRYVYTGTGYGLNAFDASDPRNPVYFGQADDKTARGTAAGHRLFVWWCGSTRPCASWTRPTPSGRGWWR